MKRLNAYYFCLFLATVSVTVQGMRPFTKRQHELARKKIVMEGIFKQSPGIIIINGNQKVYLPINGAMISPAFRDLVELYKDELKERGYLEWDASTYKFKGKGLDPKALEFFVTLAPKLYELQQATEDKDTKKIDSTLQEIRTMIDSMQFADIVEVGTILHYFLVDLKLLEQELLGPFGAPTLLHTLQHGDILGTVAFSQGGTKAITASWDYTAKIWDVATGNLLHTLEHGGSVFTAAFSQDGTKAITASRDNTAKIWDVATGTSLYTLQHEAMVHTATFSHDGTKAITASEDSTAKIWDVTTGNLLHTLQHGDAVWSAEFSQDGTKAITASRDKTAKIWDAATGNLLHTLHHDEAVSSAKFSHDGTRAITASFDDTAKIWDVTTGNLLHTLQHSSWVYTAAFSHDGTKAITASRDKTAKIWDVATGNLLHTLQHRGDVNSAAFSHDGTKAITASHDNTAAIWDVATGNLLHTLQHGSTVWSEAFSHDGTKAITASRDKTAKIWSNAEFTFPQIILVYLLQQAQRDKTAIPLTKDWEKIYTSLPENLKNDYKKQIKIHEKKNEEKSILQKITDWLW